MTAYLTPSFCILCMSFVDSYTPGSFFDKDLVLENSKGSICSQHCDFCYKQSLKHKCSLN